MVSKRFLIFLRESYTPTKLECSGSSRSVLLTHVREEKWKNSGKFVEKWLENRYLIPRHPGFTIDLSPLSAFSPLIFSHSLARNNRFSRPDSWFSTKNFHFLNFPNFKSAISSCSSFSALSNKSKNNRENV